MASTFGSVPNPGGWILDALAVDPAGNVWFNFANPSFGIQTEILKLPPGGGAAALVYQASDSHHFGLAAGKHGRHLHRKHPDRFQRCGDRISSRRSLRPGNATGPRAELHGADGLWLRWTSRPGLAAASPFEPKLVPRARSAGGVRGPAARHIPRQ